MKEDIIRKLQKYKVPKENYGQLLASRMDNLEELDEFLEIYIS